METQLQAVDRQIKQENNRHKMVIDNINKQKERENTQHEQTMRMLNSRKEQIKRTSESLSDKNVSKKHISIDEMNKTIEKATEDFI